MYNLSTMPFKFVYRTADVHLCPIKAARYTAEISAVRYTNLNGIANKRRRKTFVQIFLWLHGEMIQFHKIKTKFFLTSSKGENKVYKSLFIGSRQPTKLYNEN